MIGVQYIQFLRILVSQVFLTNKYSPPPSLILGLSSDGFAFRIAVSFVRWSVMQELSQGFFRAIQKLPRKLLHFSLDVNELMQTCANDFFTLSHCFYCNFECLRTIANGLLAERKGFKNIFKSRGYFLICILPIIIPADLSEYNICWIVRN